MTTNRINFCDVFMLGFKVMVKTLNFHHQEPPQRPGWATGPHVLSVPSSKTGRTALMGNIQYKVKTNSCEIIENEKKQIFEN